MKKIYIAKVLVEDIDCNSCSVEVFPTQDDAKTWAKEEIQIYADEYDGDVKPSEDQLHFGMESGDTYVTIDIEEKEINL